jgi:tetratricopeptide (TPR) repeat protein
VQWQSNHPEPALQALDKAIALKPDHIAALLLRAELRLARHLDAQADLEAIDRAAAAQDARRLRLGGLYESTGQYGAAIHQLDLWIDSHQGDIALASALNERCWVQAEANLTLDRALADCNAALRLLPKHGAILDSRGFVHLRRGEFDLAIADYDAALALMPKSAASLYGRGIAKLRKGQQAAGTADLAAANTLQPGTGERFERLGVKP